MFISLVDAPNLAGAEFGVYQSTTSPVLQIDSSIHVVAGRVPLADGGGPVIFSGYRRGFFYATLNS